MIKKLASNPLAIKGKCTVSLKEAPAGSDQWWLEIEMITGNSSGIQVANIKFDTKQISRLILDKQSYGEYWDRTSDE